MTVRCALAALVFVAAYVHSDEARFLCEADEQLIFGCSLGERQVSVCASHDITIDTGYVQYRVGTAGRLEQVYPNPPLPPRDRFFLSTSPYAGGGASAIRFRVGGSDHFVFEQMTRTNFTAGEPHDPEFQAGLVIRGEKTTTSIELCDENDASIRKVAYDHFPREEYGLERAP